MHSFGMDFPVSMGGYDFTQKSNEPTVIHGTYVPTAPDQGLKAREQHIAGRRKLYEQSYDELERDIVRQMSGALEGGGRPARDSGVYVLEATDLRSATASPSAAQGRLG